ncbi:MAG: hypothetical protein ABSE51_06310 [Terracidiphilus sp.]
MLPVEEMPLAKMVDLFCAQRGAGVKEAVTYIGAPGTPAALAKPSDHATATVGASRLNRCQRRMGGGASSIRPIGWESVSGLTVCSIESIVKGG